jgi:glycosyltransferase involved in cell wall biosynthesis
MSRLVKKKGIKEFIENVISKLDVEYIIVGDGPERKNILKTIKKLNLENRVSLWGEVEHGSFIYKQAFEIADVLVMPNVEVEGDAEGFGIIALEAALMGIPVVAYDVDGISEAVQDNLNGVLVPKNRPDIMAERINFILNDGVFLQDFSKAREKRS